MSTGPARRPRHQETVGLFVNVTPEAKQIVDRWASTAHVNLWEIVEALIFTAHRTEGPQGLPPELGFSQPTLEMDVANEGRSVRAA